MGLGLASFPAAPLDRTAQVVTRLMWALAGVFAVAGVVSLGITAPVTGAVLLMVAAVTTGLAAWFRLREPVAYVVDDHGLVVERRHARPRKFAGTITGGHRGKLGLRVAGDGGVYGYLGKFRADGKMVSAFVTSLRDVVLLRVGDAELAISPADPESFLVTIGGRRA